MDDLVQTSCVYPVKRSLGYLVPWLFHRWTPEAIQQQLDVNTTQFWQKEEKRLTKESRELQQLMEKRWNQIKAAMRAAGVKEWRKSPDAPLIEGMLNQMRLDKAIYNRKEQQRQHYAEQLKRNALDALDLLEMKARTAEKEARGMAGEKERRRLADYRRAEEKRRQQQMEEEAKNRPKEIENVIQQSVTAQEGAAHLMALNQAREEYMPSALALSLEEQQMLKELGEEGDGGGVGGGEGGGGGDGGEKEQLVEPFRGPEMLAYD